MVIFKVDLSYKKTKDQIVLLLLQITNEKRELGGRRSSSWRRPKMEISSVRKSSFSLISRAIGPLDFDGARRENVLRGAGYACTPDLRVLTNSKR